MQKALIIGTGGNARSVCSLLTALRKYDLLGFLELNKFNSNEFIMNFPVLGRIDFLESLNKSEIHIFLAEGNNQIRKKLWEKLHRDGFIMPNLISPNSFISDFSDLGQSNIICQNTYIGPLAILGNNNLINTGAIIEHDCIIKDHSHFAPGSIVCGRSIIGNECFLGAGSIVIDNIVIPDQVIIGAGSTVINNPEYSSSTYVGSPAKHIK